MGGIAQKPPFEEVLSCLCQEFVSAGAPNETDDEVGKALLEFILRRERHRRRIAYPSKEQENVDGQTLARLREQLELGPEYAFAEGVFRRLATDPAKAMRYFREAVEVESAKQSRRAKKLRKGSFDSLTRLINEFVEDDPDITAHKVFHELKRTSGILVTGDEIRSTGDAATMTRNALKDRVSRARKRNRAQNKCSREPG